MEALDLAVIAEAWVRLFELDSLFYLVPRDLNRTRLRRTPRVGRYHRVGNIDSFFDEYGAR